MQSLNRKNTNINDKLPIKVLQFGEGNFLRAFVDYAIHTLNQKSDFNAGVAVVQPIDRGLIDLLNQQDGLYTLFIKGIQKGKEIQEKKLISSIVKGIDPYAQFQEYLDVAKEEELSFVISNTTEAGIAYNALDRPDMRPPSSFPAKLTVFLYERYKHFNGDSEKGLTIIPCELINYNADMLKDIILKYISDWKLEDDFKNWVLNDNSFHNTLVDRIVPGYPKDEIEAYNKQLDYKDNLIVTAEKFFLWVIEGDEALKAKLPFDKTDLNVLIVDNMQPYRTRKVRILNGAHTVMVPFSLLYGNTTVKETIDNEFTGEFVKNTVFNEIIHTLEMDKKELEEFASEVFDRFRNPFIKHMLSSIALNSISKFKVRVLPSLLGYEKEKKKLPPHLTYAMACLIRFYKGTWNSAPLPVNDDKEIEDQLKNIWASGDYDQVAQAVLSETKFWDQDLSKINGLSKAVASALKEIDNNGVEKGFSNFKVQI
ncbi:tagaturonate reductase [Galbibacter sp. EGI 63066]|uniref:tagaturonate reductase n=1 Tax=Galbibacter sp. EGI 63066 TaxID=2993559 RepID=UPI0022494D99|nr:tagaturonate reductase [Galbibacter sp. EGI 63066]MCX2678402.1 tagaturonate reductase [Galbibacter sp. EGI 63066]